MFGTSCLDHTCPLLAYSYALFRTCPVPKQVELNLKHAQIQSQANPLPKSADPTERPRSLGQKRYFHLSETVSHWTCMLILAWTSIPSGYGYWKASRIDNGLCWEDWKRKFSFCFHFWGDLGGAGTYVQEVGERKCKTSREETRSWKMNTPVSFLQGKERNSIHHKHIKIQAEVWSSSHNLQPRVGVLKRSGFKFYIWTSRIWKHID